MRKKFNITGTMIPGKHFMVDISHKIGRMIEMIEEGDYFVIARPRQYGKTTTLMFLAEALTKRGDYLVIPITFEGLGDDAFANEKQFVQTFCKVVKNALKEPILADYIERELSQIVSIFQLSESITALCNLTLKKLVLLVDELDKSSNYEVVINFLGMLRAKYLVRSQGAATFQSVILAGVHDVKALKLKIRPDSKAHYGSPWNIAAKFDIPLEFSADEIAQMLRDYMRETHVALDATPMAKAIWEFTSGYPFLVSALCKIMDEEILPGKQVRSLAGEDVPEAIVRLLGEENTNFASLIKNMENNPDLAQLVSCLLLEGKQVGFTITNPLIQLGLTYGVFKQGGRGLLQIHNRVYEALIYDYLESKMALAELLHKDNGMRADYISETMVLNMRQVLVKFQEFMKDNYASQDQKFLEREGRLLFLAFLKPIINGYGYSFKEPVTSEEKRLDIVVTFLQSKYVVELKIWRGEEAHQRGIRQLADYLHRQNLTQGYLLIYDFRKEKQYKQEEIGVEEKNIFVVWV